MGLVSKLKHLAQVPKQVAALQEQSKVFLAAQGYGPDGKPLPPDQRAELDPTAFLPAASALVKRTRCGACGAPKQLPSIRAHLYCDYCGELADFDLRQATASAHTNPHAVEHAQRANQIGPAAARALKAGDRDLYRDLQRQLFGLQATYLEWAVPPRAWNDDDYRQRWIAFNAERAVVTGFDPELRALDARVRSRALRLRWRRVDPLAMASAAMGGGATADANPKVAASSLWPLVDLLREQSDRGLEVVARSGIGALDPDRMGTAVAQRMATSAIAQAYLRYLEADEGLELIQRLGISHEFVEPKIAGEARACGACGATLAVAPGASCIVCDGCGRRLAAGDGELPCTGCGATMCLPEGEAQHSCPYCRALVRRV